MLVFDTNILISFALFPKSDLGRIIAVALACNEIVFSRATFEELESVLLRTKFDRYVSRRSRKEFLRQLANRAVFLADSELETINICRDPSDNKFVELGLASGADFIVTGDDDLLVLKEIRGLRIITTAELGKLIGRA